MLLTIITSFNPPSLAKHIQRGADGRLVKTAPGGMTDGHAQQVKLPSMGAFSQMLDSLQPSQAVAYGITARDEAQVVNGKRQHEHPNAITRSDKYFGWPAGAGILMADYDAPTGGGTPLGRDELLGAVMSLCPQLASAPWAWRPSASGNVYDTATGQELEGLKGQRVYMVVADASDIPRAGDVLYKRAWLRGYGRIELAANGAKLERTIFDAAVWQPSRLDFAGPTTLAPGLERRPPQGITCEGVPLDTRTALPDLTPAEDKAYREAVHAAKAAAESASNTVRAQFIDAKAIAEGVPRDDIEARYVLAEEKQVLSGDFEVQLAYGKGTVTVAEIVAREGNMHGVVCLDPVEPEYNNYHPVGRIYNDANGAYIDSKAHGGRVFRCHPVTAAAFRLSASEGDTFKDLMADIRRDGCDLAEVDGLLTRMTEGPYSEHELVLLRAELEGTLREEKRLTPALRAMISGGPASSAAAPKGAAPVPQAAVALPEVVAFADLPHRAISRATTSHGSNARLILAELLPGRIAKSLGVLRWWTGREWEAVAEEYLQAFVLSALAPDQDKMPNVAATSKALMLKAPELPECARDERVYLQNGVLDLRHPELGLAPHDPNNYNRSCMAVPFEPGTACPQWFGFLDRVFGGLDDGEDRVALLQEMMGYCMIRSDLNVQKILALDGASRGGKGICLDMMRSYLGAGTCGTAEFSHLDDGKTQSLFRSYDVVIDSEAKQPGRATLKQAIGFLNKLASNEEVSIQLLNTQTPWSGKLNSKFVVACNGVPTMMDDSGATANRFEILYFSRSFADNPDRGLGARLQPEAQAVAMWALDGALRLVRSGGAFTQPASSAQAQERLKADNQPIKEFIESCLVVGPEEKCFTSDLWAAYRLYCLDANESLPRRGGFVKSLRATTLGMGATERKSLRLGDKVSTGFEGLSIRVDATLAGAFNQK